MQLSLKLLVTSLILLLVGLTGVFKPVRGAAQFVSNPIQLGLYKISLGTADFTSFFFNLRTIREENLKLQEERADLLSKASELSELKNENRVLRDQLGVDTPVKNKKLLSAKIIGIPYDNENSEVLIDLGSSDGLKLGDQVIYQNFLVGSVIDIFEHRSTVVMVTSPKLSVAVVDQSQNGRAKGIVTGNFGTSLFMDRILPDEDIRVGDIIVSSGQDSVFAPGLLIGTVIEVSEVKSEPLKRAKLETLINLNKLETVFVDVGGRE